MFKIKYKENIFQAEIEIKIEIKMSLMLNSQLMLGYSVPGSIRLCREMAEVKLHES